MLEKETKQQQATQDVLKLTLLLSMYHKLMRKSSADMYVSPSLFVEMELTWYACALAYVRRGVATTVVSAHAREGIFRPDTGTGPPYRPNSTFMDDTTLSCFS